MVGERIKQRRQVLGLSLQDVADQLSQLGESITRAGLSKYENNKSKPKAQFLWNLAKVYGVQSDYFFAENTADIEWLAFRKHAALTKKTEEMVKSYASEYLNGLLSLETVMVPDRKLGTVKKQKITDIKEAEQIADNLRHQWELNNWPIESVTQLLEEKGFYVIDQCVDDRKFDGLSGVVNNKNLLIISRSDIAVDRKRLNLAHELGHHLIDIDGEREESAAYAFASAFLIPSKAIYDELGQNRKNIDIKELILLKEKFGISIQALTIRCRSLGIISESQTKQMFMYFRSNYYHVNEPGRCIHREEPLYFKKMILKAVAEGVVSDDKAGKIYPGFESIGEEIMRTSAWKWNELRSLPLEERERILKQASEAAESDYAAGSVLRSFEASGDMYDETV